MCSKRQSECRLVKQLAACKQHLRLQTVMGRAIRNVALLGSVGSPAIPVLAMEVRHEVQPKARVSSDIPAAARTYRITPTLPAWAPAVKEDLIKEGQALGF